MADTADQLTFDQTLFHPDAAMRAMRDSRYRHEANAIAELIDNSIDARAHRVELILLEEQVQAKTNRVWRVGRLAVVDDGQGMDPQTLVRALSFGGRAESPGVQRIGKYGVGLPTASASQCKRVDVWTWQTPIDEPWHCFLDIGAVESGGAATLPAPDRSPLPPEIRRHITPDGFNSEHGTVVVWSDIDRITARPETIFNRVERDLGRIHRHFLVDRVLSIHLAAIQKDKVRIERDLRPNDPLFLTANSATSEPWDKEPMFAPYGKPEFFTVDIDGTEETVEVRYSMAKRAAIGTQKTPGNLPYGTDAMRNAGVSIVREGRELLLEKSFVGAGSRRDEPQHRWWGCEVRFQSGCDDFFGVDHNKQMAATFSDVAQEMAGSSLRDDHDQLLQELGANPDLIKIVAHIRATTRNMRSEIEEMFRKRREALRSTGPVTPEREAEQRATQVVEEEVQAAGPQTATDRTREQMTDDERQAELARDFEQRGADDPEGTAEEVVREGVRFRIESDELSGFQMFSVKSRGGVLIVTLNVKHALHEFLRFLETHEDDERAHRSAVAILTLILAWARMEDQIELSEERQEVQDIAMRWGRQASDVLGQLTNELDLGED